MGIRKKTNQGLTKLYLLLIYILINDVNVAS